MPENGTIAALAERLAENAMTTLEATMERLGISPEEADTTVKNNIIRLINAASAWVETITGRKFGRKTYTHKFAAPGAQELVLQQYPIRHIEYVRDQEAGVDIPPASYDFEMEGDVGVVYKDDGWAFRGYIGGLANDYQTSRRYLEVKYTAGYILPKDGTEEEPADLPADLMWIVWSIAEQEYSIIRNGAQGLAAFSISDVSWTFDKEPRGNWLETLARYARW